MRIISHRGNINGPSPAVENKPIYVRQAVLFGYDVEIDLWRVNGSLYFGHDDPRYKVFTIAISPNHWYHAKNLEALDFLVEMGKVHSNLNYFWHQKDAFTLTNNNLIWTYPGQPITSNSICVLPELNKITKDNLPECFGVCTDYAESFNDKTDNI